MQIHLRLIEFTISEDFLRRIAFERPGKPAQAYEGNNRCQRRDNFRYIY